MIRIRIPALILSTVATVLLLSIFGTRPCAAQALPTATGPGTFSQVGLQLSDYRMNYGQRSVGGAALYFDANLTARYGIESEVRTLRLREDSGVSQTTYLAGPRFSPMRGQFRPYAKLLLGRGEFTYPFSYAKGSYFVVAPGAGVDWQMPHSRLTVRVIDVEIQDWPGFSFGPLRPVAISAGIAFQMHRGESKMSDR